MATLGTTFGIAGYFMVGGEKKKVEASPPINAGSKDEANFIEYVVDWKRSDSQMLTIRKSRDFLKSANSGEQKAKH
ncbi:hypothetical protein MMC14_005595 [Varicellaria rhodocarpa]|nr:hypothetical protein [Varicellaria rhodocarpa]